jgi:glycosyltransferase involved in cell wall biosynthesis
MNSEVEKKSISQLSSSSERITESQGPQQQSSLPHILWCNPKIMDYRLPLFSIVAKKYPVHFFLSEPSGFDEEFDCTIGSSRSFILPSGQDIVSLFSLIRRCDVFVSSFLWSGTTIIGLIMARMMNKPSVIWEEIWYDFPTARGRLKYYVRKCLARLVASFFVLGKVHQEALQRLGVPVEKIFIANEYPGVDLSAIRPKSHPAGSMSEPYILFIGRLIQIKGVEYLIRALAIAQKQLPNLALTITGDGELRGKLESLALSIGAKNVHFTGWVGDVGEKAFLVQNATAVVVPSIIVKHPGQTEGGPLVVLEALSAGVPVIGTQVLGNGNQFIEDGVTGYTVPEQDASAIAEAIVRVVLKSDAITRRGVRSYYARIKGHDHQAATLESAILHALSQ